MLHRKNYPQKMKKVMTENSSIIFVTQDKKQIAYTKEKGHHSVSTGSTNLYFAEIEGAYSFLQNYKIKKCILGAAAYKQTA